MNPLSPDWCNLCRHEYMTSTGEFDVEKLKMKRVQELKEKKDMEMKEKKDMEKEKKQRLSEWKSSLSR